MLDLGTHRQALPPPQQEQGNPKTWKLPVPQMDNGYYRIGTLGSTWIFYLDTLL